MTNRFKKRLSFLLQGLKQNYSYGISSTSLLTVEFTVTMCKSDIFPSLFRCLATVPTHTYHVVRRRDINKRMLVKLNLKKTYNKQVVSLFRADLYLSYKVYVQCVSTTMNLDVMRHRARNSIVVKECPVPE